MEDFQIKPVAIESTHVQIAKWSPVAEETVINALKVLLNKSNYPILITCTHGNTLTGAYAMKVETCNARINVFINKYFVFL